MIHFSDWFPPTVVGAFFTILGLVKLYGLGKGIVGGRDKSRFEYCVGMCPSWGRGPRVAVPLIFLGLGLGNLVWLCWQLHSAK